MRWQDLALLGATSLLCGGAARAELWAYVDASGVAHFAPKALNEKYRPVLSAGVAPERVPGKTDHGQSLLTWLEFAPEVKVVQPFLREAALHTGVDVELLQAMIAVESGYKADAVSPRGATGLMQLTSDAVERYSSDAESKQTVEQRMRNPRSNVLIGARMLADLMQKFGRIDAALAAWNAGEGAVRRAGGKMPPIDETQAHVQVVLELYWALLQRKLGSQVQGMKFHTPTP